MAFPLGWPPRAPSGVRNLRFFASGTTTANFADNAFLFSSGNLSYATIGGADENGVVLIGESSSQVVNQGDYYTVEVRIPPGGPSALNSFFEPIASKHFVIELAKTASGDLDSAANTAALIAAEVTTWSNFDTEAYGTGATPLSRPEAPKRFFGDKTLLIATPPIDRRGALTPVSMGNLYAGGSPMGGGSKDASSTDPYGPPYPMVWADTILIHNDNATATNTIEVSFDGVNVHGIVRGGESITFRHRREAGIAVRRGANTPAFRIHAW